MVDGIDLNTVAPCISKLLESNPSLDMDEFGFDVTFPPSSLWLGVLSDPYSKVVSLTIVFP